MLISDGAETSGNLKPVIDDLVGAESQSISCRSSTATTKRSGSSGCKLPQRVQLGEKYDTSVVVSSLQAGKGRLKLTENGQSTARCADYLPAGKESFRSADERRHRGYLEYQATIEVEDGQDHLVQNNLGGRWLSLH